MTNIMITGGAGFIGSNFVHYLAKHRPSWHLVIVDSLTYAGNLSNIEQVLSSGQHSFYKVDITDAIRIEDIFQLHRPQFIVNLAAESHVDRSLINAAPFISTNVLGTETLLTLSRKYQLDRFLQVSTDEVYGSANPNESFAETSFLNPTSPYSASKAAADLLSLAHYRTFNTPVMITRSSNNYGPYQFPEKLIPLSIMRLLDGYTIPIYGDGTNIRDWLYVTDHCEALLTVLENGNPGSIYNIGSGKETTNLQIIELIKTHLNNIYLNLNNPNKPFYELIPDRLGHDKRYSLETSLITRELGWLSQTQLEEGLQSTVQWYVTNKQWLKQLMSGKYIEYYEQVYKSKWAGS